MLEEEGKEEQEVERPPPPTDSSSHKEPIPKAMVWLSSATVECEQSLLEERSSEVTGNLSRVQREAKGNVREVQDDALKAKVQCKVAGVRRQSKLTKSRRLQSAMAYGKEATAQQTDNLGKYEWNSRVTHEAPREFLQAYVRDRAFKCCAVTFLALRQKW